MADTGPIEQWDRRRGDRARRLPGGRRPHRLPAPRAAPARDKDAGPAGDGRRPRRRHRRRPRRQRARTSSAAARRGWPRRCSTACASTTRRVAAVAEALRDVAALPDPVGEVVRGSTLANGLQIRQVRVPMGVVGMIYEARPNVTVDAAGLALKSGNAVILRGGSAAGADQPRPGRRAARHPGGARAPRRRGHAARRGRPRRRPGPDDAPAGWSTCSSRAVAPT